VREYLLDTHTAIWLFEDNDRLSLKARQAIKDLYSELFISIISVWEVAIKAGKGRMVFEGGVSAFLEEISWNTIPILDIKPAHIKRVETLPFYHRDPFDRLLIAAAQEENMIILSADKNIPLYDVQWIW
jgi:PIN domain nuclease of toxin-antitoxin system